MCAYVNPKDGPRVVMHDSTNFSMQRPTNAALQRALWNAYYSMCCAKAGVATQLCGWIYGLPLQTGHSDDTRFIADSNILRMQREFAENDSSSDKPCLNIFDKGYQCVLQALMEGQECLQPTFAESDTQFTDRATLYSAAVAVVTVVAGVAAVAAVASVAVVRGVAHEHHQHHIGVVA